MKKITVEKVEESLDKALFDLEDGDFNQTQLKVIQYLRTEGSLKMILTMYLKDEI